MYRVKKLNENNFILDMMTLSLFGFNFPVPENVWHKFIMCICNVISAL